MTDNLRGRAAFVAAIILMALAVYALTGDDPRGQPPSPNAVWVEAI